MFERQIIGLCYENGYGVKPDAKEAAKWYEKAAQRGDIIAAPAMAALGRMYENGFGLAKDMDTAQMYYDKAKATGYTN